MSASRAAFLMLAILQPVVVASCRQPGPPPQPNNQCVCALQQRSQLVTPQFKRYQQALQDPARKPDGWKNLAVQIADIDGDGTPDLSTYVQHRTTSLHTSLFTRRGPFFATPLYPNRDASTHGTALIDVDGDGLLDMIIAPHSEKSENQSDEPMFYVGRTKSDLNVTNRPLCVQQSDGRIVPIWSFLASIPDADPLGWNSETIAVGDVNGDGRVDIFVPFYHDDASTKHRSLLLMNTGQMANCEGAPAPLLKEEAVARGVSGPFRPDPEGANLVDLRGKGLLDLVVAGGIYVNGVGAAGNFRGVWLRDLGLPSDVFSQQSVNDPKDVSKDEGLHVVDYDRDGSFDLYLRMEDRHNLLWRRDPKHASQYGIWFTNDYARSGLEKIFQDHTKGHNWGDAWGDFNLDGSFDLIYQTGNVEGSSDDRHGLILLNNGKGVFQPGEGPPLPYSDITAVGDLDDDGLLDLYFAHDGEIWLNTTTPPPGAHALAVSPRSDNRRDQYGATVLVKETCPRGDGPGAEQIISVGGAATYLAQGQYDAHVGVEEGQCYSIVVQFPSGPDGAPKTAAISYDPARERGRRIIVERHSQLRLPSGSVPIPQVVAREPYGP